MASFFLEDGGKTAPYGCKGQPIPLQADVFYHLRLWHRYAIWSRSMLLPYAKYNCFSLSAPFFLLSLRCYTHADQTACGKDQAQGRNPEVGVITCFRVAYRWGILRQLLVGHFLDDFDYRGFVIYIGECHFMLCFVQLVAFRCFGLNQIISGCLVKFTILIRSDCKQSAGCMAVFVGGQCFYHFAISIPQFKFCTFQCSSGILVRFLNNQTSLCDIIFHRYFLDLCGVCYLKGDALRSGISIVRLGLCQGVRFSYNQFFDDMRLLGGCPFLNNSLVFIGQL